MDDSELHQLRAEGRRNAQQAAEMDRLVKEHDERIRQELGARPKYNAVFTGEVAAALDWVERAHVELLAAADRYQDAGDDQHAHHLRQFCEDRPTASMYRLLYEFFWKGISGVYRDRGPGQG